ncbi:ABC transporter permease [Bacillus sp. 1P06AnD]|uniref:ABC transporter permease n=1 Tax=Bacillus sp. 1P06AnD TaxID=3132208 RepID=UPI00399EFC5A
MLETIKLSVQAIWSHKLRSLLTMLGVIIGITAIISIFNIIEGNSVVMKQQIAGGSNNTMEIEYGGESKFSKGILTGANEKKPAYIPEITEKQMNEVRNIPGIKNAALLYKKSLTIFQQEKSIRAEIIATTPNYFDMKKHSIMQGRLLTQSDMDNLNQVAVINKVTFDKLFPKGDGIGQHIEINGSPFKVVGVVEEIEEANASSQFNPVGAIFVPVGQWTSFHEKVDPEPTVLVQGENTDQLKSISQEAINLLLTFVPKSDYIFGVRDFSEYEKNMEQINKSQLFLLGGIASLSLIVGGIGVMNIMLVSVTERTREIGVKKALGAKRKTILFQFLIESIILTLIGGIIGIVLGLIVGKVLTVSMGYPFIISLLPIFGSLMFSLFIGVVFGIMPAFKASKLNPIEALRYE